jgi:uncharacterized protein (TIGR04255 family)
VIIGIQFKDLPEPDKVLSAYLGVVRGAYPNLQSQPRLRIPVEQVMAEFPTPPVMPGVQIGLGGDYGRSWLVSSDESLLIQIQSDLFMHNWRRREGEYPHFEQLSDLFWERFREFRSTLAEMGLAALQLTQLEVTYVNWISGTEAEKFFAFAEVSKVEIGGKEQFPEYQQWVGSYLVAKDGTSVAKLTASCAPGMRVMPKMERGFQFSLTYRSPLPVDVEDDVLDERIQQGRFTIDHSFFQLTTEQGHKEWGVFDD